MKITKYGHCCMLIEENGTRILTDPGRFTTKQNEATDVDALLITHEHGDHYHIDSIKEILAKNPTIVIITNSEVGALLAKENIVYTKVEDGDTAMVKNLKIEGSGSEHAIIDPSMPPMKNTGFFIGERFFYPGDALHEPGRPIDILALPTAAPWLKFSEAVAYARSVTPKTCFPVHDGILKFPDMMNAQYKNILESCGVRFVALPLEEAVEF